jgi:hypothetical protein
MQCTKPDTRSEIGFIVEEAFYGVLEAVNPDEKPSESSRWMDVTCMFTSIITIVKLTLTINPPAKCHSKLSSTIRN